MDVQNERETKMKKTKIKPNFDNLFLDGYEKELEKFLSQGKYVSAGNLENTKRLFQMAARNHNILRKSKRITIRVNHLDLLRVKAKAKQDSIPYQTLLGVLIHRYAADEAQIQL